MTESGGKYLQQIGGPALGLFQMEPATHDDIWDNYLKYRTDIRQRLSHVLAPSPLKVYQLRTNLLYAAMMCRIHYWRVPEPLPDVDDIEGMANYHKIHYNSIYGKADPAKFARLLKQHIEV